MRGRVGPRGSGEMGVAAWGGFTTLSRPCPHAPLPGIRIPRVGFIFWRGVLCRCVEGTGCCRAAVAVAGSGHDVMGALRVRPGRGEGASVSPGVKDAAGSRRT